VLNRNLPGMEKCSDPLGFHYKQVCVVVAYASRYGLIILISTCLARVKIEIHIFDGRIR
jgi:hypothetical protein